MRALVPPRSRIPKRDILRFRAEPERGSRAALGDRDSAAFRLLPWRGGHGRLWWGYHCDLFWNHGGLQILTVGRVYLNGADNEVRFYVLDPFVNEGHAPHRGRYGAANDFCHVTHRLADHFGSRLSHRGIYPAQPGDFLTALLWCDVMLRRVLGLKHDVDALGGERDELRSTLGSVDGPRQDAPTTSPPQGRRGFRLGASPPTDVVNLDADLDPFRGAISVAPRVDLTDPDPWGGE